MRKTTRAGTLPWSTSSKACVDVLELALLPHHTSAAGGMQLEDLGQVAAGANNRTDDGDAVEHGLEDRQLDLVVRREADEHEAASALQAAVRLLDRGGVAAVMIAASTPPYSPITAAGSLSWR